MRGQLSRLRRAFDAVVLWRARRLRDRLVERSPALAEHMYRGADATANLPFRSQRMDLPGPIDAGDLHLDVMADLEAYTGLPRTVVEREVSTRSGVSFRAEWHATPSRLRHDHWYYLSSKGYLFANAVHFADSSVPDRFVRHYAGEGGRVLDFGAGTGNLALLLAAAGHKVWVSELNALQRDFIRFRVDHHALSRRVTVVDPWAGLPEAALDAVVAVDVLEHLPDCRTVLERQLLPALTPGGVLVENSPFVINSANPMHHEDFGFERFMRSAGFDMVEAGLEGTRVWQRP